MACHHERYDGTGYPNRLAGEDIPLCARIVAVADVYDALTSNRVYRSALPHATARRMIIDGAGSHFDPDIVQAFVELSDKFESISLSLADGSPDCSSPPLGASDAELQLCART